nr:hypothetical protein [uncultured Allomuricauda sp.]
MKNTTLIRILWITCLLALILIVGSYSLNFGKYGISESTENWGQFGDYIGGLLNPIISIINLAILTYLSIKLVKIENNRNEWTLKELARPYGEFIFNREPGQLEILVKNFGLGPMIITNIEITNSDNTNHDSFEFLSTEFNDKLSFTFRRFGLSQNHAALSKGEKIVLLRIKGDAKNANYKEMFNRIIEIVNSNSINIKYSDMYEREIGAISEVSRFKLE